MCPKEISHLDKRHENNTERREIPKEKCGGTQGISPIFETRSLCLVSFRGLNNSAYLNCFLGAKDGCNPPPCLHFIH